MCASVCDANCDTCQTYDTYCLTCPIGNFLN